MRPVNNIFHNQSRLSKLHDAFAAADREAVEEIISSRANNMRLHTLLQDKNTVWTELKKEVVFRVSTGKEDVVVKIFPAGYAFPFHELGGNLLATGLLTQSPFFVRTLDIGRNVDEDYVLVMEYLPEDTSSIDMTDPVNMYNLFYQTAYACVEIEKAGRLQHFDLRYDNIMIRKLPESRDLFRNGIKSSFVIKVGDFGQCEFDFGDERPMNEDIPREARYQKKWGLYPTTYTGYDFQYFLSTLTPIMEEHHSSFYYIHQMALSFLEPIAFTNAQYRPKIITHRTPTEVLFFLKREVIPTLGIV
jgi:serine/threonine protein kinase